MSKGAGLKEQAFSKICTNLAGDPPAAKKQWVKPRMKQCFLKNRKSIGKMPQESEEHVK